MPGRLPRQDDFYAAVNLSITPPSSPQPPTNVLILLHGLGDTHQAFTKLGQQMNLPETACISLRAPNPMPFDLQGFHWGDDLILDQSTGGIEADTGFKAAVQMLQNDVIKPLTTKCGYKTREIVFFGFAQGGMVALALASDMHDQELGGVITIGGPLPISAPLPITDKKCKTPILLCKGVRNSAVSESAVKRMKEMFEFVEVKEWRKSGDSMMGNREEMMPVMQFFARRLLSRSGVPKGAVEIT